MRNLKKFLALVLAMMMAMSLMVTANAAVTSNVEYSDDYTVNEAFEEAVTVLSGMSVIKGYNGGETFAPKQNITRAEAATLVYRLATGDVNGEKEYLYTDYALQNSLTDVTSDKWYAGAVGYCANFGIVKGRTDGLFHATDPVTGYEILAMILRVVGYDKNGEFSGTDWAYNVSTLANSLGVTNQVKTANYSQGGTSNLYAPATREVVASLLFETIAYVPKVIYSPALGYSQYGIVGGVLGQVKNDTVGHDIFGLRFNYGIVVGNEDTGEGEHNTKIGFDLINSGANLGNIDDTLSHSRVANSNGEVQSAYVYNTDIVNTYPKNVTLNFKWDSNLGLFGHKVKVWYSDISSKVETAGFSRNYKFPTDLNTYAVFDKTPADGVKVIHGAVNKTDLSVSNTTAAYLGKNVSNFDTVNGVYWNYAFGPTAADDHAVNPGSVASTNWTSDSDFASPIKAYNNKNVYNSTNGKIDSGADTSDYPLYLVISNHPDGKADIVISLDMTISQITQVNSVFNKVPTVGVYNANSVDDISTNNYVRTDDFGYFDRIDDHTTSYTTDTSTVYTEIAQANMTKSSTKNLGDKVVAIAITGTTGSNSGNNKNGTSSVTAADLKGNATAASTTHPVSNYYYKLSKLNNVVPGTVYTVDTSNGKVTLSDGSVLERSPYANIVDASFATAAKVTADTARFPLSNVTYSFTLDRDGKYIYFEGNNDPGNFVYATYLDYVTELNSSTYKYSITAVNGKGERRQVYDVTKWDNVDFSKFDAPTVAGYNSNGLPKRDSTSWGTVVPGRYIGYIMSGTTLREVTATGNIDGQTMNVGLGTFDMFIKDDFTSLDSDGSCKTSITPTDAVIGAKQVAASDLFLTEDTIFHIVSGAGTDTQDVKTYKGLSELTAGMRSVVINGGNAKDTSVIEKDWSISGTPYNLRYADMTYFTASPFNYAQNYGFTYGTAKAANVVYLPADAVTFNKATSSSLYFVGDNSSTTINAYGENAVQFTMYQDGVKGTYWVEGNLGDDTHKNSTNYAGGTSSSAGIILKEGKNVFYGLADSGKKTNFGETIYRVVEAADPWTASTDDVDDILIGQYWNGTNVDISRNANLTTVGDVALYNATTNALQAAFIDKNAYISGNATQLYNVTNAKVASANSNYDIKSLSDLHAAGSLYDNMGVPVSCVLSADSNRIVSFIYVNA